LRSTIIAALGGLLFGFDTAVISGTAVALEKVFDRNGGGARLASCDVSFHIAGVGREVYEVVLPIPKETGKYLLKAVAFPHGTRHKSPTICRRKVSVEPI